MIPISLFRIGLRHWTLAGAGMTLGQREVCIAPTDLCISSPCESYDQVFVREDGTWLITPQQLEVRWISPTIALMKSPGTDWVEASLSSPSTDPSPLTEPLPLSPVSSHGVVPGLWRRDTANCNPAKPAWLFKPLQKDLPQIRVVPRGDGWVFDEGDDVVMCTGGKIGGIFPARNK